MYGLPLPNIQSHMCILNFCWIVESYVQKVINQLLLDQCDPCTFNLFYKGQWDTAFWWLLSKIFPQIPLKSDQLSLKLCSKCQILEIGMKYFDSGIGFLINSWMSPIRNILDWSSRFTQSLNYFSFTFYFLLHCFLQYCRAEVVQYTNIT